MVLQVSLHALGWYQHPEDLIQSVTNHRNVPGQIPRGQAPLWEAIYLTVTIVDGSDATRKPRRGDRDMSRTVLSGIEACTRTGLSM